MVDTDDAPVTRPMSRFDWERVVRRARALPLATKGVAYTLATYADDDGGGIFPGEQRLAAVCGIGERMVRKHVAALRAAGLLEHVSRANRAAGRADVHRLAVPVDVVALEALDLIDLDPVTGTQVPVSHRNSGSGDGALGGVVTGTSLQGHRNLSVDLTGTQVPPTNPVPTTTNPDLASVAESRTGHARDGAGAADRFSDVGPELAPLARTIAEHPAVTPADDAEVLRVAQLLAAAGDDASELRGIVAGMRTRAVPDVLATLERRAARRAKARPALAAASGTCTHGYDAGEALTRCAMCKRAGYVIPEPREDVA